MSYLSGQRRLLSYVLVNRDEVWFRCYNEFRKFTNSKRLDGNFTDSLSEIRNKL